MHFRNFKIFRQKAKKRLEAEDSLLIKIPYFLNNNVCKEFYFKEELRISKNICLSRYKEKAHTEIVKCLEYLYTV